MFRSSACIFIKNVTHMKLFSTYLDKNQLPYFLISGTLNAVKLNEKYDVRNLS